LSPTSRCSHKVLSGVPDHESLPKALPFARARTSTKS
jgi:hypothetical protein